MLQMSMADELAEIRAEIARLKTREAALRAHFLRNPGKGTLGRWTKVEVVENRTLRFDPALLPDAIRQDPHFYEERLVQIVRCVAAPLTTTVRAGWPIDRGGVNLH